MSADAVYRHTAAAESPGEAGRDGAAGGIGYLDAGPRSDTAVVLLHSLGADHRMWARQVTTMASHWRVISPDSRGHGRSAGGGAPSVDQWIADLDAVLDDAGVANAYLVGVSLGGIQGLAYAAEHHDRVRGLVVADSFVELDPAAAEAKIAQLTQRAHREGMTAVADVYVAETLCKPMPSPGAEDLRDAIAGMSVDDYCANVHACFGVRIADRLARITAPTLVLWGKHDGKAPRHLSDQIAKGITGARLVEVPGAAHLPPLDNPETFTALVAAFVGDLENVRRGMAMRGVGEDGE